MSGLDPLFGQEHDDYRAAARQFVAKEIAPHADEWEASRDFPRDLFSLVGKAGFFGAKFDDAWGGTGPDYAAEAVWIEEVARAGTFGTASDLGAHSQLAVLYLDRFGSDDLKERYLRASIAGELTGALCVTEPSAGSDVNGIRTRAVRDGDGWALHGSKVFITNGSRADYLVIAARTSEDPGHANLTLFVVDADTAGLERNRMELIAWHTSHTGEIFLDDVRVPDVNRLGDVGAGFGYIMANFQWERITMSLGALALADLALTTAIDFARERRAFGKPVLGFQVWQHRFADLAVRIRASRALTYRALRLWIAAETGGEVARDDVTRAAAMAKLHSQRLAARVADECVQVHGGAGALMEYRAQRFWRDARVGPIGGGTDDIMRNIIATTLGLGRPETT